MKTTRHLLLRRMVQFAIIISIIYCTGCDIINEVITPPSEPSNGDADDNQSIIADMPIKEIEVLIEESDPVQVSINVIGYLSDSCTAHHETHQEQEGNTITIKITTIRPQDTVCAAVITEHQEQVAIGTLPAGDYKVIANDVEQEFRVN